jgi:hypothetical protein
MCCYLFATFFPTVVIYYKVTHISTRGISLHSDVTMWRQRVVIEERTFNDSMPSTHRNCTDSVPSPKRLESSTRTFSSLGCDLPPTPSVQTIRKRVMENWSGHVHISYASKHERLQSFVHNFWPHKSPNLSPTKMPEAGFFHSGEYVHVWYN